MSAREIRKRQTELRDLNAKRRRLQGKDKAPFGSAVRRTKDVNLAASKRLTVSEVARTLLNRTPREMSHVGLSRGTSGGQVGIEVVAYQGEGETLEETRLRCESNFAALEEQHPRVEKGDKLEAQLRDSVTELKRKPKQAR